jgi:hypothetical protein
MNRVAHLLFGHGSVIESRTTESGRATYLVRFDNSDTDRLILADSLKPTTRLAPGEPVKKPRRKVVKQPRARKADPADESISDKLLVPELDDALIGDGESETEETLALM